MNNQELREIVNPVFNTAKACVQLDAATGDEDAKRLLDALGFESFGTNTLKAHSKGDAGTSQATFSSIRDTHRKPIPGYEPII